MAQLPSLVDMMADLVSIPSVTSSDPRHDMGNQGIVDLLAQWCETLGFSVKINPVEARPGHVNLIATRGRGNGGLVLAGHTDTVPFDDRQWSSDPFKLSERDGRYFGLGTTDMKGFFAFALEAVQTFEESAFSAPLTFVATADEETSMMGARALNKGDINGRYVVIGEPTSMIPVRMHKGNMMERIHLVGRSGHSSNPAHGRSAIEGMHGVISEILSFRAELQEKYRNPGFDVPVPTLNLGCIHGGDNANRICGSCEMAFDLRLLPGLDGRHIREQLRRRIRDYIEPTGLSVEFEILLDVVEGMETPTTSALVETATRLTGAEAGAVSFATEAPFYQEMGMDVVVMGPGDIDCAHQPNENIRSDRFNTMTRHLTGLINTFCVT